MKRMFFSLALVPAFLWSMFATVVLAEDRPKRPQDVIWMGTEAVLHREVNGDCLIMSGNIDTGGTTGGDRLLLGREVNLAGVTGQDARLAGVVLNVPGVVKGNVSAIGQRINIDRDAYLNGNLHCTGAYVDIKGHIEGNVQVLGGTVVISGDIGGDVVVEGARVGLNPGARIRGSLNYYSPHELVVPQGVEITGETKRYKPHFFTRIAEIIQYGYWGISFFVIKRILGFVSLLFVGLFMLKCFPVFSGAAAGHIAGGIKQATLWGILLLILAPLLSLIFIVSVIGAPLGIIFLTGLALLILISKVTVSLWLGQSLTRGWDEHRTVPFIMGAVIISLLTAFPVIGPVFWLVTAAMGIGGIFFAYRSGVHLPINKENISEQTNLLKS
ncbi:MAG: polymer-forming cytoskeletal protein [Desulfitobacteriaceae bacterium]|nr:polymer-forming cytoskeletal protein [Desulfitobacteriaceae bacterium]MDD4751717.1 polymer-forming cytoskeletal protein [Desulfitobacteriaceae bacterium]